MLRLKIAAIFAVVLLVAAVGLSGLKREMISRSCLQNLRSMTYAGRLWANGHAGVMPTNFICFSNELIVPRMMICPADHGRTPVNEWSRFDAAHCSYELVGPGARLDQTNGVFLRCKVHHFVCQMDGTSARR